MSIARPLARPCASRLARPLAGTSGAASSPYLFSWDMESAPVGNITSYQLDFGAAYSTNRAVSPTHSLRMDPTQGFSQAQVFNDTNNVNLAPRAAGFVEYDFAYTGTWQSGKMIFQLDGKSNVPAIATDDGFKVESRNVGGAVDKGIRLTYSWANGTQSWFVNSSGLNMAADTWYHMRAEWKLDGSLTGGNSHRVLVDSMVLLVHAGTAIAGDAVTAHHYSVGNDTSGTGFEFYLDNFRSGALI